MSKGKQTGNSKGRKNRTKPSIMTSRRIASNEKALLDEDDNSHATSSTPERSNITPAVPTYANIRMK